MVRFEILFKKKNKISTLTSINDIMKDEMKDKDEDEEKQDHHSTKIKVNIIFFIMAFWW